MCDQQSLRSACAYAQSDQSLCLSLEYYMTVKLLTEQNLEFLSLKEGCTGSSVSTLVKMPHCWKLHVTAHLLLDPPTQEHSEVKSVHRFAHLPVKLSLPKRQGRIQQHIFVGPLPKVSCPLVRYTNASKTAVLNPTKFEGERSKLSDRP